ncbi:unnamed protein product [Timema podura]|uniref:Ig-like domain-containing protein n=1 Tax=Timema podura TaxID=61482 RepID=A0ABN7NWC2_TIMPD|nr:unnamed protein product [Timema podura]
MNLLLLSSVLWGLPERLVHISVILCIHRPEISHPDISASFPLAQDLILSTFRQFVVTADGTRGRQRAGWLLGAQDKGKQAIFLTAKSGEFVVFNCQLDLPVGVDTPLDLRWSKEVQACPTPDSTRLGWSVAGVALDKTIYSLADEKDPWVAERYKDRILLVSSYARSSINLTSVRESDGGWYSCGASNSNSTPRFRLTVNTPPRFLVTPEDMIRINFGDAIILSCQAEGRPAPEIRWYKDASPVEPSATVGLFNQGSELRISDIWQQDLGDYTCIAGNTGGQISHTSTLTTTSKKQTLNLTGASLRSFCQLESINTGLR